jgi:hypothetical protein
MDRLIDNNRRDVLIPHFSRTYLAGLVGLAHSVPEHVPRMLRGLQEAGVGLVAFSAEGSVAAGAVMCRLGELSPEVAPLLCSSSLASSPPGGAPVVISRHMLPLLSEEQWAAVLPLPRGDGGAGRVVVVADMSPSCPESEGSKAEIVSRLQGAGHVVGMVVGPASPLDSAAAMRYAVSYWQQA